MQLQHNGGESLCVGADMTGAFKTSPLHHGFIGNAMPAFKQGMEQFDLDPGITKGGQYIDMGQSNQVIQFGI